MKPTAPQIYAVLRPQATSDTRTDPPGATDLADPHLKDGGRRLGHYVLERAGAPAGIVSIYRPGDPRAGVPVSAGEEVVALSEGCVSRLLADGIRALASAAALAPIEEAPLHASGTLSAGIVLVDERGLLILREPRNHFGNYNWTYSKGRIDAGETPQQTAHRELLEETGLRAAIVGRIGDFKGDVGTTRFYVGMPAGGVEVVSDETEAVGAFGPCAALSLWILNRQRDQDVLVRLVECAASAADWTWSFAGEHWSCRLADGRIRCNPVARAR